MLPEELAQMFRAYQPSRILLSAVELDLFTAIGDGATAAEVAERRDLDRRATTVLLDALAALELLVKKGDRYSNSDVTARHLDDRSPESERLAQMHSVHQWEVWSTLTDCVRQGGRVGEGTHAGMAPAWTEAFIAAMARNASARAPQVAEAVGVEGVTRVLDVGGGPASYSIALARANPNLRAVVVDKAEVLEIARRHIQTAGMLDRIDTIAGNIASDALGTGFDLALVSNICHMFSPEHNVDLLKRCAAALVDGGRLVIQDFVLNDDRTSPPVSALFAINMLVATPEGNSYSESDYRAWMEEAGFTDIHRRPLASPSELMIGSRKG